MAQDPYGYPETAPPGSASGAASTSLWSGIGALICATAAPCCCYVSYLAALPLSIVALYYGTQAQGSTDAGERTSATAGMVSGGVGLAFSLVWLALVAFYVLYIALIAVAAAAGSLD